MASGLNVMVTEQGKAPKLVKIPSSGTVRAALKAAGFDPDALSGAVTVDGNRVELGARLKNGALISVTPKVAGGR